MPRSSQITYRQIMRMFREESKQRAEEAAQYKQQRAEEAARYEQQRAEAEARYEQQRAEEAARYEQQRAEAEARYEQQRAEAEAQEAERKKEEAERKKEAEARYEQLKADLAAQEAERKKEEAERKKEEDERRKEEAERKKEAEARYEQLKADLAAQEAERKKEEAERKKEEDERRKEEAERKKEADKRQKDLDRQISKLGNRIGELIEHLTASNLLDKFRALGYNFTRTSRRHILADERKQRYAEIDLLLENGEFAMVVEVKSLFTLGDVKDHVKRMNILREYADQHNDPRSYRGATAGAMFDQKAREYALSCGFYVIEQSGDTVEIQQPPQVKTWRQNAPADI